MGARQPYVPNIAIVVVGLGLAACGAVGGVSKDRSEPQAPLGPPAALASSPANFFAGESMTFVLSLRGITGGEANLAVGAPGVVDGRRQIIVSSRVESAGLAAIFKEVRDEVTTTIDLDTGRPVFHHAQVRFGDRESTIETRFAEGKAGGYVVEVTPRDGKPRRMRQAMPPDQAAFDMHSAMGALRAWRPVEGETVYLYAMAGRQLWQLTLRMTGRERIVTTMGRAGAVRVDGVARRLTRHLRADRQRPAREFTVWLSDDDARLPLMTRARTEYGDVAAELVDYQRPDHAIARAR